MSSHLTRLWLGAFSLSLLFHVAAGWALASLSTDRSPPRSEIRIELRQSLRGQAERVAPRMRETSLDIGPAVGAVHSKAALPAGPGRQIAAIGPPQPAGHADPQTTEALRADLSPIAGRPEEKLPVHAASPGAPPSAPIAEATTAQAAEASSPALDSVPSANAPARVVADAAAAERVMAAADLAPTRSEAPPAAVPALAPAGAHVPAAPHATVQPAVRSIASTERSTVSGPAPDVLPTVSASGAAPAASSAENTAAIVERGPVPVATASAWSVVAAARQEPSANLQPPPAPPAAPSPVVTRSASGGVAGTEATTGAVQTPAAVEASVLMPSGGTTVAHLAPQEPSTPEPREDIRQLLLGALKGENGNGCFGAFATELDNMPEVRGFAADPARLGAFEQRFAAMFGTAVSLSSHRITAPQCVTLAFAHEWELESATRMLISLDRPAIASGTELSGRLSGTARPWLHVLVVDDEGIVHELPDLQAEADGSIRFRAPLTLTNGRVGTDQLLIAIAADEALDTASAGSGLPAEAFFGRLQMELRTRDIGIDIGMAGFRVE